MKDWARATSYLAAAELCALAGSLVLIAIIGGSTTVKELEFAVACLMGVFLIASISAMIGATVQVVRNRRQLADWRMFLIFIWAIPYMGITLYLGTCSIHRRFSVSG